MNAAEVDRSTSPKDLLRLADLGRDNLLRLLETAGRLKRAPLAEHGLLRGETVVLYFGKPSTRTRISFETAVVRLGGVVINKVDTAGLEATERVLEDVLSVNPTATIVRAASPPVLAQGPSLRGKRVLVVEDGPTLTHGGMSYGAGTVAAQQAGVAERVDPRPFAVGSIAETFRRYPQVTRVLPAMGYSASQVRELEATINAADCDVVVTGTPIDLGRLIDSRHPVRHVTYELQEIGAPTLPDVLVPLIARVPVAAG